MLHTPDAQPKAGPISPLTLSDQMIGLAQAAERVGLLSIADRLVRLACDVFDEPFKPRYDSASTLTPAV